MISITSHLLFSRDVQVTSDSSGKGRCVFERSGAMDTITDRNRV